MCVCVGGGGGGGQKSCLYLHFVPILFKLSLALLTNTKVSLHQVHNCTVFGRNNCHPVVYCFFSKVARSIP